MSDVAAGRAGLLQDASLTGAAWCRAFSAATDAWLADVFDRATATDHTGLALVAVGGYGRGELAPASDLDLLLLHHGRKDIAKVAERLWYPLWDAKVKLGHAVRTVKEAVTLAADDLDTATALLTVRHLAGDPRLTGDLHERAAGSWRKRARRWVGEVDRTRAERHAKHGEVAFLLEPDLKEGRGGLRDVHCLAWVDASQLVHLPAGPETLADAYDALLAARVELHRRTGRAGDVLALQEQDGVAEALGMASADELMARVSAAARTIAWAGDEAWHRIRSTLAGPGGREVRRDHHLAPGVFTREGEVHVDPAASPADDPALCLRVATVSARTGLRVHRGSLEHLAAETPAFGDPWPVGAADELVALLLEAHRALDPIEALDQMGIWARVLPEWAPNRCRPQRNAYHRFTVDRHLLEAAANAADLAGRVGRPDLLVVGALLHDIGKGYPGDHTEVGMGLVGRIGPRMGFGPDEVDILVALVQHHLLLADVATRRDISDDGTIAHVAAAVGSGLVLDLLHALTEADSMATGPGAWGPWRAELVAELVDRAGHVLGGGTAQEAAWKLFPGPEVLALMGSHQTTLHGDGNRLTVVAPDRAGLFSKVAGVLSLHGVDVFAAQAHSDEHGMAASEFLCHGTPDWARVVADLHKALDGRLALEARLAERVKAYGRRRKPTAAAEAARKVLVDNAMSSNATVLEVHAPDAIGVLYRTTRAMADMGLDIRHAKVQTLGHEVVDAFYVRDAAGAKVTDPAYLAELQRAILYELSRV